jgi:hypothetical protein
LERPKNIDFLYHADGIPALQRVLERWDLEPMIAVKVILFWQPTKFPLGIAKLGNPIETQARVPQEGP